jgi:hypothetical protein
MMIIAALGSFAVVMTGMALAPSSGFIAASAPRKALTGRDPLDGISSERLSAPLASA